MAHCPVVGAAGPCKYEVHEDDLQFEPLQKEWEALSERNKAKCALQGCTQGDRQQSVGESCLFT